MTADQYRLLLQDLARLAGLTESSGLVEHGRVKIGDIDAVLEHNPAYDENLVQVRTRMGTLPEHGEVLSRALLEANYISAYGGECVFSLFPGSDDVVVTMRLRLESTLTAQELWQSISDIARHGSQMWDRIVTASHPTQGVLSPALHPMAGMQA